MADLMHLGGHGRKRIQLAPVAADLFLATIDLPSLASVRNA
jgi:hypothetical protein